MRFDCNAACRLLHSPKSGMGAPSALVPGTRLADVESGWVEDPVRQ